MIYLSVPCNKSGFTIASLRNYNAKEFTRLTIACTKGRVKRQRKGHQRLKPSQRPDCKEERCPFYINVYYHISSQRWYFLSLNLGCLQHCHHKKISSTSLRVRSDFLAPETLEKIFEQLEVFSPTDLIKRLLKHNSDITLTPDQIRHLRRKLMMSDSTSTSTRLFQAFDENEELSYLAITVKFENGQFLSFQKVKGSEPVPIAVPHEACKKYYEIIQKGLGLKNGEEFFLGIAWILKEGKRYHRMFPHVLGMDSTFGTNNEKRPLFRVTGRATSGKNIPILNAYFPIYALE